MLARAALPWRALLLAALLAVLGGVAAARVLAPGAAAVAPVASAPAQSLTASAQTAISARLGADDPGYRFTRAGGSLLARNSAQGLGVAADSSGVRLSSTARRGVHVGLTLSAAGYGSHLAPVAGATARTERNRVTLSRGPLQEWYVNGPFGVEQGFTLARPPAGSASLPLTLAIRLSGGARASLGEGGRSVTFSKAGARSLRYGGLSASDATGRPLRTRLQLRGARLYVRVDAASARFPVRIDPTVVQTPEHKAGAGGGSGEPHFGYSVAVSADGNTALIGAPRDSTHYGAVWVFVRHSGAWVQQGPKLLGAEQVSAGSGEHCGEAGEEEDECGFGRRVALSADGNTALVGNPRDSRFEPPGAGEVEGHWTPDAGAAWVFVRDGESWSQMGPKLTPEDEHGQGRFGKSVALSADGSTALIGGSSDAAGRGSAWVFVRSPETGGWVQQGGKLGPATSVGEAHFGLSVALSGNGDTALVGGPGDGGFSGAAWIFNRSGASWSEGAKLTGADEVGVARFGFSVALSSNGSTAIVGGRGDNEKAGAAWIFAGSGGAWSAQSPKLTGEGEGPQEDGYSVALSADGGTALVGAPRTEHGRGAAWLYLRSGGGWGAPAQKFEGSVEEAGRALFGTSVALTAQADAAVVGGPNEGSGEGAAWLFGPSPRVTGVTPHSGPAAGGTTVTISGSNLQQASAVHFGAAAASFSVQSPNAITATSPPGEGTVDVTVTTPLGTSTTGSADQFRYTKSGGGTREGGSTPAATPTGTLLPAGGVLGYGAASGDCRVALASRILRTLAHGRAAAKLKVSGFGRCRGKLRLRVIRHVSRHKTVATTIGTAVFSISAGHGATARVKLNVAGRARLARGHGRLHASLLLVRQSPLPFVSRALNVTVAPAVRHAAKHAHG